MCTAAKLVAFLFLVSLAAAQDYKTVLKESGRVITGRLVSEDETSVVIEFGGVTTRFKKSRLDLERMKELNRAPQTKSGAAPVAPGQEPTKVPNIPFSVYDNPEYRRVNKDLQRSLQNDIARLTSLLSTLEAQPPSTPHHDRDIQSTKALISEKRGQLEDRQLEVGESNNPEATRLFNRIIELTRTMDREHREYFEALRRKAPQEELDRRMAGFLRVSKELGKAQDELSRYMRDRK